MTRRQRAGNRTAASWRRKSPSALLLVILLVVAQVQSALAAIVNTVTVSGTFGGAPITAVASETVDVADAAPAMTVVKAGVLSDVDGNLRTTVGDAISYTVTITNTGNISLTGISVADPLVSLSPSGGDLAPLGVLDVGEAWTYAGIYTLLQADLTTDGGGDGDIDNIVTVGSVQLPVQTANTAVPLNESAISAVNDGVGGINGASGGINILDVLPNDLLNGIAPVIGVGGTVALGVVTPATPIGGGPVPALNTATGLISVPAGTPQGIYTITYQICEILNVTNCAAATATIGVDAAAIAASNDDFSAAPVNGLAGGNTATVFINDTLNGVAFAPAAVTRSIAADGGLAGVSINASGTLTIPAGTPGGTYTVTYEICEILNSANCDTADAIVMVADVAAIEGTVFYDLDSNGLFGGGDTDAGAGYLVELYDSSGVLLGSDTTDASGFYSITTVPGAGYRLLFTRPGGVAVGQITGLTLPSGLTVADQNQPIDPSGIVYNSLTRLPVAGVTVTITDAGGTALPLACLIDASQQNQMTLADGAYRFDIVPACLVGETEFSITFVNPGYAPGVSATLPPTAGPLQVTGCAVVPAACQISASAAPPPAPGGATYYLSFLLENGDPNVVNNHIPIDPIIFSAAGFTKTALVTEARRGERVPYVIEAAGVGFSPARIVDIIPPGFDFVVGSATSNAVPVVPTVAGRNLTFDGLTPDGLGAIRLELVLVASIAVATGPHVNTAQLINPLTNALVSTARATVTITAEHVFDCGDIIGRVFDDKNRNGYQDERERGLAGVRLVTVKGVLITTDKNGLFHVACADVPDADIGSNFILKLDIRTLPEGYNVTTENPRIVRLTSGKLTKLNFGAAGARLVRFDMTNDAFVSGSTALKPQWLKSIDKLMAVLEQGNATLRLTYIAKTSGSNLAMDRAAAVEKLITERWAEIGGRYRLSIETRVAGPK